MKDNGTSVGNVAELLREMGADKLRHANGRSLYDHLTGTEAILRSWSQPDWITDAGALHSIYGTEIYQPQLTSLARRSEIQAAVGLRAERLVYLFGVGSRHDLFRQIEGRTPDEDLRVECQAESQLLTAEEAASLAVLHMANIAEQSCAADGSPGLHLARISRLGLAVHRIGAVPPVFDRCTRIVWPDDESAARDAYVAGLAAMATDRTAAISLLTEASQKCPWVAEPLVWLAYLDLQQGKYAEAGLSTERARKILGEWGTAWDKRLSYERWNWLIDFVAAQAAEPETGPLAAPDPQNLARFCEQLEERNWVHFFLGGGTDAGPQDAGTQRFYRYVASFREPESNMKIYPGLEARAWHEAENFPLAMALEAEYPAIRKEILALDQGEFAPETEPIRRTGNWNVLFFHERGRRNEKVCARCPVTSRVLDAHRTIHTLAGLSYVSRLAPGTHITTHRGPTNLRLRCHLAIRVPEGNCGIRVDSRTRQWREGKCLVFDDYLPHEAWNHTGGDRVVLIVDLWHPGLSDEEVALLEGLHRYAATQAASLNAYWSANEKARCAIDERGH
jgi:aspartyl/asparaginyl beta-hydroxylase (cupin superfamily)